MAPSLEEAGELAGLAWPRRASATGIPGRLDSSTSTPYASEMATPCAGGMPTSIHKPAAAPSRTPHPATESGTSMESSSTGANASSSKAGIGLPMALAAHSMTTP
ncbi:hypothetical protein GCM10007157_27900 [Vreelandella hamiltonii]|uniref:Uncharacterized protein n=1 Tax=Vreelandella hamiltonii TaxID=502829 RepID=A0A8H9M1L6_9GAMM|nr:hypothetical protein GCM10007157_27900 [Halomonas hamiltonii]